MFNLRRVYIFVVTAVSLNAVAWAVIALLRNLLVSEIDGTLEFIALQLSIIIIGLPIYLVHWLWAERLAQRDEEEREATLRFLYLYIILTAFLVPFISNAYSFMQSALRLLLNAGYRVPSWQYGWSDNANLLVSLIAMVVLALLWGYHFWVVRTSRQQISDTQTLDTIHRLYIYLFSFAGLIMTSVGLGNLLRWLMFSVGANEIGTYERALVLALTQLIIGLPLWLVFWLHAESLFNHGGEREQTSALRKFYLYLIVFLAALGTVGGLTTLLAGLFRRLFALESQGDVRNVLCVLITTAVVWGYHFWVLRQDTRALPEVQQQANVRRLYWYLIAGIGLMALLIGIGGDVSVLIRSLFGQNELLVKDVLQEQLAWFSAILIAGLAVWIIPWRNIQAELSAPEPINDHARQALSRKIYLYFYLLLAALTFLGAGVYILSQIVLLVIGGRTSRTMASDMAHAIAFSVLAVAVWSYHIMLIRQDNKFLKTSETQQAEEIHVVVVDDEDGRFGQRLIAALHQAIPDVILHPLGLTPNAIKTMNGGQEPLPASEILTNAQIIVGPWTIATPYVVHGQTDMDTLAAISTSPGQKLLIPKPEPDWDWSGVGEWQTETAVKQTIYSIKQLIAGKTVKAKKGYSLGTAIAIGLGIFVLINLLPLLFLIPMIFLGF